MENIKLKLPTKLSAIKLKDFQKYMSIVENNPDADRNFLEIKLMEIFCGLKYKNIEGLPFGYLKIVLYYLTHYSNLKRLW